MTEKDSSNKLNDEKNEDKKATEKVKPEIPKKIDKEEEPSWYHYIIVIALFALIIYTGVLIFDYFDEGNKPQDGVKTEDYYYKYKVGNITYNIEFTEPVTNISNLRYWSPITKEDLWNTADIKFSFNEYNGTDNGYVSISSIKLRRFLDNVFYFSFEEGDFVKYNETNCSHSTFANRVFTFNPYSEREGVFVDENGCVIFEAKSAKEFPRVVDKFIYDIIVADEAAMDDE
jgi:hypothetical protein